MRSSPDHSGGAVDRLFVDFDGRQLVISTDIPQVRDFVEETFTHMLVPAVTRSAGEIAVVRTSDGIALESGERFEFGGGLIEPLLPLVKDEVRRRFMESRNDLLWLHAGAVEKGGKALLLSGPSGQGKSTMTTTMCDLGWRFLSDDIAPVRMDADVVIPFPQSPVRRIHPGRDLPAGEEFGLKREVVAIDTAQVSPRDAPIHAIVFIRYSSVQSEGLSPLPRGSAALELLRNLTNFLDHREAAVEHAAQLARRIPAFLLNYRLPLAAGTCVNQNLDPLFDS